MGQVVERAVLTRVVVAAAVGRTGALTSPEVVADVDVETATDMLVVTEVDAESDKDVKTGAPKSVVVVVAKVSLEEALAVLEEVGEAVTVGLIIRVVVEARTPESVGQLQLNLGSRSK